MGKKFLLQLTNIGPLKNLKYELNEVEKIQMVIFARNGSGKTFISRAFRTFEIDIQNYADYAKTLLNNESEDGEFKIQIGDKSNSYKIGDTIYSIKKEIDRKFYTFNSDYVFENLVERNYNPNSKIDGFIFGKNNIDLSEDKKRLSEMKDEINSAKSTIIDSIKRKKKDITKHGINANLQKFKNIGFDQVLDHNINNKYVYSECAKNLDSLNKINDETADVMKITYNNDIHKELTKCSETLQKSYTLGNFEEDFRSYVSANNEFINRGVSLYSESSKMCPFCGQELDEKGYHTVHKYIEFVNNEEARINNEIISIEKVFSNALQNNKELLDTVDRRRLEMKEYSTYFGSISENDILALSKLISEYNNWIKNAINALNKKKLDISKKYNINDFTESKSIDDYVLKMNKVIDIYNKKKNDITTTKREYKNNLCDAALDDLKKENINTINKLSMLLKEYKELEEAIKEKEYKTITPKKELVANDFEKFINSFFYEKYKLNKDTFELSLNNKMLSNNPDKVLSDGEKTVLSFCYYLANIHGVVDNEDEYNKLILIIDDSISSLDIDYIYQMVTLIKNYGDNYPNVKEKFIILTHNLEFYNLLVRNNIACKKQNLYLNNEKINIYEDKLIMPYEFHLLDIYNVSRCKTEPTHTTANSIRHVLETINQFEGYSKEQNSIEVIIKSNHEFSNVPGVYTFMEDLSHGRLRFEQIQNKDMVIKACKAVIEYVSRKYNKQIENINNQKK